MPKYLITNLGPSDVEFAINRKKFVLGMSYSRVIDVLSLTQVSARSLDEGKCEISIVPVSEVDTVETPLGEW